MCFTAITALGPLVIGACVAYVAYQQHRTSRERLRFDLYDKRYSIYSGLREALWKATTEEILNIEVYKSLNEQAEHARFLFPGTDVADFIREVNTELCEFDKHDSAAKASDPQSQQSSDAALGLIELGQKLSAKRDRIHEVFAPYLRFNL